MEEEIRITQSQLVKAFERWSHEAAENNWPERTDDERHQDNASYLLALLQNP